ncbi:MAG: zinc ribbon domain-containing protein [Ruthenibacterium sp.]|uniref:Zinc-ribbon domain-containing protein n=1 Tax=Ruthenibacterium lactatiformans TaxID=1550024 RepID=A0A6I3QRK9_9FIRM|nr:zinc ribbon domain-containing protein [Ruthenibacterium sp.]MTS15717.1 zinc-ribbon domain-containing protein [Ruthenibacterium lactatiformans]MTS17394.1 zinc-ribbon domain-containing protein [Ruthenibacterium lactatiformans]MTS35337.1 zinc-ribbon domain-containing protein [Ruthenibacterium lactatiformans]MTS46832.1 zinc-ribbon domain-containing protein [Ruthenibacterium lactatiformans]
MRPGAGHAAGGRALWGYHGGSPPVPTASAGPPGTERSGAAPDAVPVFCPLCGQRLPSGVAFCPGCGTPIS